jgi:hypothetical protein
LCATGEHNRDRQDRQGTQCRVHIRFFFAANFSAVQLNLSPARFALAWDKLLINGISLAYETVS